MPEDVGVANSFIKNFLTLDDPLCEKICMPVKYSVELSTQRC